MKCFMFLVVLLFVRILPLQAQDVTPIPRPDDYLASCQGNSDWFFYFGPNCLNPVHWDLPGFRSIGQWVFFTREEGTTDGGVIVGFTWQWHEGRYHYYLMTQLPDPAARFGGKFETMPPERLIPLP
jgi:hypothetical protein